MSSCESVCLLYVLLSRVRDDGPCVPSVGLAVCPAGSGMSDEVRRGEENAAVLNGTVEDSFI